MDTRQGTHMESFLLTRSVSGLLMNGCSKSVEGEQVVGKAGGAQGSLTRWRAAGQTHGVRRLGVRVQMLAAPS